jgi:hypothetical protein
MKKLLGCIAFIILAGVLTSAGVHKYYVAVFQMEYVPAKKVVQITGRIFLDDLENGLNKKYGKKLYLSTPKESAEANDILKKYFSDKIQVKVNGTAKSITFLGRETEDDVLICYFSLPAESNVTSMQITNTLLFEAFAEQQNIIHTKVAGNKKSLLLTNDTPTGTVQF